VNCKNHVERPAVHVCVHCKIFVCSECVRSYPAGGFETYFCPECNDRCEPVSLQKETGPKPGPFASSPGAAASNLKQPHSTAASTSFPSFWRKILKMAGVWKKEKPEKAKTLLDINTTQIKLDELTPFPNIKLSAPKTETLNLPDLKPSSSTFFFHQGFFSTCAGLSKRNLLPQSVPRAFDKISFCHGDSFLPHGV